MKIDPCTVHGVVLDRQAQTRIFFYAHFSRAYFFGCSSGRKVSRKILRPRGAAPFAAPLWRLLEVEPRAQLEQPRVEDRIRLEQVLAESRLQRRHRAVVQHVVDADVAREPELSRNLLRLAE